MTTKTTDIVRSTIVDTQITFENVKNSKVDFKKEGAFALQILKNNSYLYKIASDDPVALADAVVNVALTGLTLNPVLSLAYLLPRDGKIRLVPSYMGLCKILTDTGSVKNIYAYVVYKNDLFKITLGTNPDIIHEPAISDRGEAILVYACAVLADGSKQFEYMNKVEVDKIMSKSEAVKAKKYSSWTDWWGEMARKAVIRRLYKYLSKTNITVALEKAIELTNDIDFKAEKQKFEQEKREREVKRLDEVFKPEPDAPEEKGAKIDDKPPPEEKGAEPKKKEAEKQTTEKPPTKKVSDPLPRVVMEAIYGCKTEERLEAVWNQYPGLKNNHNFINLIKDRKEFIKEKVENENEKLNKTGTEE